MKSLIFFIICPLLFANIAFAQWPALNGSLSWHGVSVDESLQNAKVMGTQMLFSLPQFKVAQDTSLIIEVGANLEIGSSDATYIKEFAPDREVILRNAYVLYSPWSWIELNAGAISQGIYNSPLLVGSRAFVAAKEQINFHISDDHLFYVSSEQAIPSNDSLTNRIGSVEGKTPQFMIHSLGMDLKGNVLDLKLAASLWRYNSLSSSVAYYSRFMGNTVSGIGTDASRFFYGYYGKNVSMQLKLFNTSAVNLTFEGQWLINDDAAENHDTGMLARGYLGLYSHRLGLSMLRNESDSSVAFYNSSFLGHNNRKGIGLSLDGPLSKDWEYEIETYDLDLIDQSLYQSEGRRFRFALSREF